MVIPHQQRPFTENTNGAGEGKILPELGDEEEDDHRGGRARRRNGEEGADGEKKESTRGKWGKKP